MPGKPYFATLPKTPTRQLAHARGNLFQLLNDAQGASMDVHLNVINVDSGPGEIHYHERAENIYFVLEGCLEVVVEGERHLLYPNDVGYVPPGLVHTAGNAGTHGVCRVLEIYAPPGRDFHVVDDWPARRDDDG